MDRLRARFEGNGSTTFAILVAALLIMAVMILPRVLPAERFTVPCTQLANPIPGGNNQSLLARRSQGALDMEISLPSVVVPPGQPLTVNVTFINNGVGTITLFFQPDETLLRDDGTSGLSFVIERVSDRFVFEESPTIRFRPERTQFPNEFLHLLGPRQRCTEPITLDAARLADIGLNVTGQYSIRAIYRNLSPGTVTPEAGAVATPLFNDQGVYTVNDLRSREVLFNIGAVP